LASVIVMAREANQSSPEDGSFKQHYLKQSAVAGHLIRAWNEEPVSSGELDNGNCTMLLKTRRGSWNLVEYRPNGMPASRPLVRA